MRLSTSLVGTIINNYDQVELFAKYLNLDREYIDYCLKDKRNKIRNPLRDDNNASLSFMYKDDGKLVQKDWANSTYDGDIFDLIGLMVGLDPIISNDFITIFKIIVNSHKINNSIVKRHTSEINKREISIIKIQENDVNMIGKYFSKVGITKDHLKLRNVFDTRFVWINDMNNILYGATKSDPIIGYYIGEEYNTQLYKIYRPFSSKGLKFSTNSNKLFEAPQELYKTNILIITKSRKEKLTIEANLKDETGNTIISQLLTNTFTLFPIGTCNTVPEYCVTSFNSETYLISPDIAEWLNNTYDIVAINTDYDKTGIINAFYHYILYGFTPVMLGNSRFNINMFSESDIKNLFNRINLVDTNVTLHKGLLSDFIEEHRNSYSIKDIYEYGCKDKDKLSTLINNIFDYNTLAYERQ